MKVRVLRGFPYSSDGVNNKYLTAGTEAILKDEKSARSLCDEGYVEEVKPAKQPLSLKK